MRFAILVALITAGIAGSTSASKPYSIYNTSTGTVSIHNLRGFDSFTFIGDQNLFDDVFLPGDYITTPPIAAYLYYFPSGPFRAFFPPRGATTFDFDSIQFSRVVTDPRDLIRVDVGVGGETNYLLTPRYVPEPSSLCIAGAGLAFLAALRRRK